MSHVAFMGSPFLPRGSTPPADAGWHAVGSRSTEAGHGPVPRSSLQSARFAVDSRTRLERLLALLRERVKEALPAALADAREAFALGMGAVGTATFLASMRLAGIDAASHHFSK